jgi:hypothetical protein
VDTLMREIRLIDRSTQRCAAPRNRGRFDDATRA